MSWLSLRLACSVLFGSLSLAGPALAQVPVYIEPSELAPPPAASVEPPTAALPAAPPAPTADLPAAPPAPPGVVSPTDASSPAPAKADRISVPSAKVAETSNEVDDDDAPGSGLKPAPRWYGWQTLLVDGASFALAISSAALDAKADHHRESFTELTATSAVLGYEFGPGIVHFAHRNPGRGFASFGLRLGMPLAGAFLGAGIASGCDTALCEKDGAAIGFLAGMGGAIALDAAVFAYDDPRATRFHRASLLPLVSLGPQKAWFGLSGQL